jgi:glutathione peroxidase
MKAVSAVLAALVVLAAAAPSVVPKAAAEDKAAACPAFLDHEFRKLHSSQKVNLCREFAGKPMLIVNTASHCGFTPQFKGLEAVHQKYKDKGLVVVGFSSNDFNPEAADEETAAEVCFLNNGVTFTMISTTSVKGPAANPVFKALAAQTSEPRWNFNKYVVSADGKSVQYFDSRVTPESPELTAAIEKVLD